MFKRPYSTLIKIYIYLFSVGLTTIHSPVLAQNNYLKGLPFITNYRYQDYGADGVNWWVEEDDQGVLYFANAQGVLIYDGQRWELVKPPGAPETRSLVKGADGKIYVGTNGDIGYLAPGRNGKLEFFSLRDKLPEDQRLFAEVWETQEFQGEIYFRTNNKVFIWNLQSFRILESQEGFHVGAEVNDQYYVRIWTRGLTVLKQDSFHLVPNGEKFANERIYVILPYDDNRLLIGARTQGMFIYDGKDFTPFKTEADPFIVNTSLYGGRVLSNGLIALNTFNDGMAIIDKQGKLIQRIDKSVGLQDNSVDQVFEDSRGILWMPLFNGIAKFDLRSSLTFYNDALGLPSKTIFSVGSHNNQIYAGTNNGIYILNRVINRFENVQGSGGQTGNFLTNGKDLLVSGAEKGLLKLEGNKAIAVIPGINYDFHLRSIIRSKLDTTVLYCALRSGLAIVRYSPSTEGYAVESFAPILNQSATLVSETPEGNLWMNGDDIGQIKLVKPDKSSRKWVLNENSVEVFDSRQGLPRKNIAMMEYDSKVYFATETDSIYVFSEAQKRFVRDTGVILNQQFVLYADYTLSDISDPLGRIWANFGQGVFVAIPAEGGGQKIINAPFKELRKNYPIWDIALSSGSKGEVIAWMSGREGIIRYDGNLEINAQDQFSCILRGITLNEDSVFHAGLGLTSGIAEFNHGWNTVQFEYAAPFFKLENETRFSSILEGRDKHWSDWDKQNFKEFGNLPAGLYTFRVKAKNIYDTESSVTSFTFTVLPPWYSTWWAYLLYALLAGALIYAIVRWRTRQLHEKHRELEIMVDERTAELKQRVDELAVINSVQEGLASKLDLQAIYDLVGDKIRDVFDAQGVAISYLDRTTNQINNPYYLFKGKRINQPSFEFGKGMTSKVIRDGQPLLINEKAADRFKEFDAVFTSTEKEDTVKSWLGVPLISAGKVNGVIKLENYNKEFAYSEGDVSLLQTLANSMSVALENARLFDETNRLLKETEQRTGELAVINSVQEGLAREIDIQSIYEMVGDRIKDLFNAQAVLIASFDHETGIEHFNYQNGTKGKVYPKPRPYDKLRQHLIDTKQLILINEKTEEAAIQFGLHVIAGTDFPKSMVFTPLSIGDKVNGYISLQNISHENAFSEADVRLLSTISNSMSVALENARLFDETNRLLKETEQRTAELAVINSVQEGLARELDMQGIYDLVGERIRLLFDAQAVVIATLDLDQRTEHFKYAIENGERFYPNPRPYDKLRQRLVEIKQKIVINTGEEAFSWFGQKVLPGTKTMKSGVFVPLILGEKITSYISLQNVDKEYAFSVSDIRLLETLANSMSVALENARLFDETNRLLKETEQRTAELAVINSVQDGLAKELDIQAIYELVGDRIIKVFNAPNLVIRTFDHINSKENWRYAIEKGERQYIEPKAFAWHSNQLIQTQKPLKINDHYLETSIKFGGTGVFVGQPTKSGIFVPLMVGELVKGSVSLQNVEKENAFTESDLRLLTTITNSMSVALENARLFDETNRLLKETEQRTGELAVINSVQEGLARELDLQGIYNLIGDRVQQLFNAQAVIIASLDLESNTEHFNYVFENNEKVKIGSRPINKLRQLLIDRKQVIYIATEYQAMNDYGLSAIEGTQMPKSLLFVPMLTGNTIKGYVSLQNIDLENAFSSSDIRLLETLANSMSVALENARLFDETNRLLKETEQRTAELAVINSVQDGLAKELDIRGIYNLVGDRLCELFPDSQTLVIRTFEHDTGLEHWQYAKEKGIRQYVHPRPFNWNSKQLILSKKPLDIKENYIETAVSFGGAGVTAGQPPKSALFVPMIVGDLVKGSISLQNVDTEFAFNESDLRLLTTLTNSMSVALENARLFDETNRLLKETEQRTAELAVINSVQEGLARELDMQGIYDLIGDRVQKLFNAQAVIIATLDLENRTEHFNYIFENNERVKLDSRPFSKLRQLLVDKKHFIYIASEQQARNEYGVTAIAGTLMPKSLLFVPMLTGNIIKGYVSLQNMDIENAFSHSDIRLLETLANSMSVALENARLFDETNRLLKETEQRTAELAVINSVQEGLAKELDMRGIYDLVGDRLCELFPDTQTLVIRTFDHESGIEHFQYAIEKGNRLSVDSQPFIWASRHLIEDRKAIHINENYLETSKKYGGTGVTKGQPPKSAVFVPMLVGDLVKGSISLQNVDRENAFSDSDLRLLTTITNSMSVALENARLFDETNRLLKETEQRTAELAVINSVQDGLVREMDINAIYELVGKRLCDLFNTQTVLIRTFDHSQNTEIWRYVIEKGERHYSEPRPLIWANKYLIRHLKPLLINENYLETSKKYGGSGVSMGLPPKSAVFVPMIVGDIVKGSVSLQNVESENAFSDSDLRLLTTITNSMSVALENARLFDETTHLLSESKQRAAELSTVNSISRALASQLDPDDLINLVGDQLKDLFRANIVYLALLNFKTNIIDFPYQFGEVMPSRKIGEGLTSKIIMTGEPLLINKDMEESTAQMGIQHIGLVSASYLGVPIPVGDKIIGVLSVQSTEQENRFNENDLRLLSTIASSVGVALNNATLFEEVKMAKQEAEEASLLAEKANEAKSAFLSTVSHELRTPLTSVLGFAKIIKKRLEERIFPATNISDPRTEKAIQQVSDNLNVVVSEGQRLTSLINDVLDLAKIEAGKMQWNQENVSLKEVADRAIAATTSLFDQKSLVLIKEIEDQLPEVIGDKDKLIQVMVNLISNSVKFTPEGTVTCKIYRYDDEVRVSISDTGIGIAPKDHAAVFEQFKQVGDTLTDKPKGTGLGLPICKEIVEHHGGRIWLESELGKGSTFIFALPLKQTNLPKTIQLDDLVKQLKEQVAQSQLNVHGQAANILIVDDDDSIRSLLQQELGEAGYQIEEARNGKEALAKVRDHRPDLILLDIMMPEMNGFDVAAVLKNDPQTMDIPIIVLSIVQDKARGFKIGVDRYLSKPIDTGILFNEIGSLLEQGKSKKKVMIVDEDSGTVNTLTEVLKTKGYVVMDSNGKELVENALAHQPDIIIINAVLSGNQEMVKALRFEKGMEDVLFLLYQ